MEIVLHVGLPKTATTYLQEWLNHNKTLLSSRLGVLPSQAGGHLLAALCCPEQYHGRSDFVSIFRSYSLESTSKNLKSLRAEGHSRAVISSEYFFLASPARISEVLTQYSLDVKKVIVLLRRQDRLIGSGYAQDIKELARSEPIGEIGYSKHYDWSILLTAYAQAFPEATVVPLDFDFLRRNRSLVDVWKRELGVEDIQTVERWESSGLVNESLPGEMVELCRASNALGLPSLTAFSFQAARAGIVSAKYELPADTRNAVRDAFCDANDAFVASLDDPTLFHEYTSSAWKPSDTEKFDPNTLRLSTVARLLAYALLSNKARP